MAKISSLDYPSGALPAPDITLEEAEELFTGEGVLPG